MASRGPVKACTTCGREYEVCPVCEQNKNRWFSWRRIACSPQCYQIHNIVHDWYYGEITPERAAEKLVEQEYTSFPSFTKEIADAVEKIMEHATEPDTTK